MNKKMGFYPIVDRAAWFQRLLPLGVTTLQLRVKDLTGTALADEIAQAVVLAKQYQAQCFINDYWQLAIDCGADGVHLGQEDVTDEACQAIHRAQLNLGISTHGEKEMRRALTFKPSYLAVGPIYPTSTKDLQYIPQGLAQLKHWVQTYSFIPLVAIGGITLERINEVAATEVAGIAVISAVTKARDPESAVLNAIAQIAIHQ